MFGVQDSSFAKLYKAYNFYYDYQKAKRFKTETNRLA